MSKTARRREDLPLSAPNSGGNVWPKQSCPAFTPRGGAAENTCWYCVYADFHLDKPRALDVGICNWPEKAKDTDEVSVNVPDAEVKARRGLSKNLNAVISNAARRRRNPLDGCVTHNKQ